MKGPSGRFDLAHLDVEYPSDAMWGGGKADASGRAKHSQCARCVGCALYQHVLLSFVKMIQQTTAVMNTVQCEWLRVTRGSTGLVQPAAEVT